MFMKVGGGVRGWRTRWSEKLAGELVYKAALLYSIYFTF